MNNPIDGFVMPSKRDKNYVQFFLACIGDEPFICGADGHFTSETLSEIEKDFLLENDEAFSKGAGDYLFEASYEPEQRGEYGVIEIPAWWNLSEVMFEPLEA